MPHYGVTFVRDFQVEVEADCLGTAETLARRVITSFPAGSCKLLSVVAADAKTGTAAKAKRRKRF
jgi:hypothetical protein